ncbi:sensor histidine kinase [Paractinoplanes brasiliensis]|uniref:Signal transduction histidine kinase n=1 Tax=Paractinoplanes brasiliensis TaxID=52695 RepID=A0A4R6JXH6_9ACTN|nr:sensor histidine kinase [Actinoplanes brasiliensis]TDO41513.1 signal transduction histidine kinase [Actinoplanes brasiliensis]GID27200.1 histidine kinase [Actinoplanes brasiliensis]
MERTDRIVARLPYIALGASVVLVAAAVTVGIPHAPWPIVGSAVVVTAAWLAFWIQMHPEWEHDEPKMIVFFAGLIGRIYLLIWSSPLFGFFVWSAYLLVTRLGSWRRVLAATLVATALAVSHIGGFASLGEPGVLPILLVVLLINAGVAHVMIWVSMWTHEQGLKRNRMVEELALANTKLAAALKENAGLHAQLLAQAREAGVLDERQRMAGEIHDVLAQGLTGIVTQLEATGAAADRPDDWRRHLDNAKRLARDSLTEARRSVQALRPQTLDGAMLPDAIGDLVTDWSRVHEVAAELVTTGTPRPLVPEIEATLLRTAQEALANVGRHADAGRVGLTLSYMEDVVTLDVRDDGHGFDPGEPRAVSEDGGYGLAAMRERLARIAGSLEVESAPGSGTALSACVPAIPVEAAA